MLLSMTGFGRASRVCRWGTVTFEIMSVNHRYQEISVRLPKEIASFESDLVYALRSLLKRGKIRLNAEINWAPDFRIARIDTDVLKAYFKQLKETSAELPAAAPDLSALLILPGVCDTPRLYGETADKSIGDLLKALISDTADALMEMKKSEGEKLRTVIEEDLAVLERLTGLLSKRWEAASSEAQEALRGRIDRIMERFNLELDENRIAQEVSILADKWDVSEELARLSGHISKFREIVSAHESEGRKLDFLIQEMNREVNTMGSKTGDAKFRWIVVEAKSCLERIREQIQNVE